MIKKRCLCWAAIDNIMYNKNDIVLKKGSNDVYSLFSEGIKIPMIYARSSCFASFEPFSFEDVDSAIKDEDDVTYVYIAFNICEQKLELLYNFEIDRKTDLKDNFSLFFIKEAISSKMRGLVSVFNLISGKENSKELAKLFFGFKNQD